MCKIKKVEVRGSRKVECLKIYPSAPEAVCKINKPEVPGSRKVECLKIHPSAPEAMCKINRAEVPGSRKVECLKIHQTATEAMTKFTIEKDISAPEAMCKYSKAKKRVAEFSTIPESAPEAMMKSDKGGCLEDSEENVWKTHSSAPEAMPKVGIARGLNMNTSKLHTSHLRVLEVMVKIDGGSFTIGEREPRLHRGMRGERPRSPQRVSDMNGSSKLQFNPTAPFQLDGKIRSKLGAIGVKDQIAAATKSDDAKVPEYLWDMRALGLE
jgi:hypothetical protein